MDIIYWRWSKKGEYLEQSAKRERSVIPPTKEDNTRTHSPLTLEEKIIRDTMFHEENKREKNDERLSKRKLVTNRQINPYLIGNDYLNDLSIQDNFLRPKNSNFNVKNKDLNDK